MIRETVVTTRCEDGSPHIAPMGVHDHGKELVLAPFRPSGTLKNLLRERCAVINYTDDVRIFAGCLTGRYDWPLCAASVIDGVRLCETLAHAEVEIVRVEEDDLRPRLHARVVHEQTQAPFRGFNRAQAAVVEAAILVSRLGMLADDKIDGEIDYLGIAVTKTAGAREQQAWDWLMQAIKRYRAAVGRGEGVS